MRKIVKFTLTILSITTIILIIVAYLTSTRMQPTNTLTQIDEYIQYFKKMGHNLTESNWTNYSTTTQLFKLSFYDFNATLTNDAYFKNYQTIYFDKNALILFYNYHNRTNQHVYSSYMSCSEDG